MSDFVRKLQPALKHAGYAATAILPGENQADFDKLHKSLIAEFAPNGILEEDIVATMARLVWRKRNLVTFRVAELARKRYSAIRSEKLPNQIPWLEEVVEEPDPAKRRAAIRAAEDAARQELGSAYELVEIGDTATVSCLLSDLNVEGRLDGLIDRCLKRLLFLKGLKSISNSGPAQRMIDSTSAA